ncbi:MAG: fatty acid--CoA ligase, partial [Candidatus Promineifilaceae bacterium]|nr:fatty acid--CoA ligase [Candidatus Promineifilaceae bacterium]
IVDRLKDMFISGGINVYPAEVENVLFDHPDIAEVAVIGVPHTRWHEAGRALVVPRNGVTLTEVDVIDFCQGKLARYKIPKSVVFMKSLPRTASGKVLKRKLVRQFGEPIEE